MFKLLDKIWELQPKGYYAVSSKHKSKWQDKFFKNIDSAKEWLSQQKNSDLYFCITPLKLPRRIKENVLGSYFLWQDLDKVNPNNLDLKPTIAWESSPGKYQALWQLDKIVEPKRLERLNRSLCKYVKADKGSWILTKVLRIPGTYNYKYSEKPKVKLLWDIGRTYTASQIREKTASIIEDDNSITIVDVSSEKIPPKIRRLLQAKEAPVGIRSDKLWYMEHELAKAGFTVEQVYSLIRGSIWNKYKGRKDEHERLIHEISEVFKKEVSVKDVKIKRTRLIIENDLQFMSDISNYPGWLVNGFWTRKSHGIIAGEPKSFKSTLSLDLAISVASGMPFLGEFSVTEQGPVLVIQNENAPWIMKDRLEKIRAQKGLIGSIEKVDKKYSINFPPELPLYYLNQQGFSLSVTEHKKFLEDLIIQVEPKLVVLDPLYLMFEGDINSAKDLSPVLNWLLVIKEKYNLSLVIVHHWRKSQGGARRGGQRLLGSVTLHGWLESAWYISIEGLEGEEAESKLDVSTDLNAPSATSIISLEREFRGAGVYPKIDLAINIGEFGEPIYDVSVNKHRKRKSKLDKHELSEDILNTLSLRDEPLTASILSEELGVSRKTISLELKRLELARVIRSTKKGWALVESAETYGG